MAVQHVVVVDAVVVDFFLLRLLSRWCLCRMMRLLLRLLPFDCDSIAAGGISFEGGATVIRGIGAVCGVVGASSPSTGATIVAGDFDLAVVSHRSGVISVPSSSSLAPPPPPLVDSSPFTMRCCGWQSRCSRVSRQNICILYWFRHLSEQNCS